VGFSAAAKRRAPGLTKARHASTLRHRNRLETILDGLAITQFMAAGTTEHLIRKGQGLPTLGLGHTVGKAVKERRSFSEITGNPVTGFALDLTVDAANIIPFGGIPKAARGLSRVSGLAKLGRIAGEAIEATPRLRRAKMAIGETFVKNSLLKRLGDSFLTDRKDQAIREIHGLARVQGESVRNQIEQLVPTEARRQVLFDMVESQPLKLDPTNVKAQENLREFRAKFATLSDSEKIAYRRVNTILDDLEKLKIEAGILTRKHAANFIAKHGIAYVPRYLARKDTMIKVGEDMLEAVKSGEKMVLGYDKNTLRKMVDEMKQTREVVDVNLIDDLDAYYKGQLPGLKPSFTFERTTEGLAKDVTVKLERDLAKVMGLSTAEVVRAISARKYIGDMAKHMTNRGMLIETTAKKITEDTILKAIPDAEQAKKLSRQPYAKVRDTGIKEIDGKWAPKAIVDELKAAINLYQNPEPVIKLWTDVQRWWKAWQLFPFASYHNRNIGTGIFNGFLDGVKNPADYNNMIRLVIKSKRHPLKLDTKNKILGENIPLTEAGLIKLMKEFRVLRSGQMSEVFGAIDNATDPSNFFFKWMNPFTTKNQVLRGGIKVAEHIEDSLRSTHFWVKLRESKHLRKAKVTKKDIRLAAKDAAERMFKHHFDYEHGLTPFETRYFRDGIFPFYTFTRFNIPLQLEALVNQPRKFVPFVKTQRFMEDQFGGPQPDEHVLADWLKNSMNVRWNYSSKNDTYEYFNLDGWWSGADIGKVLSKDRAWQEFKNMLAPGKVLIELMENYAMYRNKKIFEFPGQKKTFLGIGLDARWVHFMRSFRPLNDADRVMVDIDRGEWDSAIARALIGRSYPIGFKQQTQRYLWELDLRLSKMKSLRTREARRVAESKGRFARLGHQSNVDRLEEQVENLEEHRKLYE
jgi:hypothetical protein